MDSFIIFVFLFFLGASVASFLQMYLDTGGKNLWRGLSDGSRCDGCGKSLGWIYLTPVFGWLLQYGKTKCCGKILNWKYLSGEIVLGLWFVGSGIWFLVSGIWLLDINFIFFVLSLILGCIFFMLVMQDLEDMSVSSRYLWIMCAVSILGVLVGVYSGKNIEDIFPAVIIFSPFWIIYFLGKLLDKPMIGEADPYVFSALGIFFGVQFSISLFLYSVWVGSIWGIIYLYFVNKKFERNIRIPFLPIIFIATLIILIFNYHLIQIQDILLLNEILFKN